MFQAVLKYRSAVGSQEKMNWEVDFWIDGQPQSAKNRRRIVRNPRTGKSLIIKSQKALDYSESFKRQCPKLPELIEGDVVLWVDAYYSSRRPDLACLELIMDLLQGLVYHNDRQVKVHGATWNLSKDRPGARIRLRKIQSDRCTEMSSLEPYMIWGTEPPPK